MKPETKKRLKEVYETYKTHEPYKRPAFELWVILEQILWEEEEHERWRRA